MNNIYNILKPPYYAVIFSSVRTEVDEGYSETAKRMMELASQQPGFLGVESVREEQVGITVSYWENIASIEAWKQQAEHKKAQLIGQEKWYKQYNIKIARVERNYSFV
jgi:heme-degrading monooxygenase HmoA